MPSQRLLSKGWWGCDRIRMESSWTTIVIPWFEWATQWIWRVKQLGMVALPMGKQPAFYNMPPDFWSSLNFSYPTEYSRFSKPEMSELKFCFWKESVDTKSCQYKWKCDPIHTTYASKDVSPSYRRLVAFILLLKVAVLHQMCHRLQWQSFRWFNREASGWFI